MNTNDFKSPANHDILHHLVEELSEAVENDPAALREALAEEGIEQDNLVQEGLQFIQGLQTKQQAHEHLMAAELGLFEKVKTVIEAVLRPRRLLAFPKYAYALAAVIVVTFSTWLLIQQWSSKEYIASRGEQVEFLLPDGSKVKLNSESRLALNFTEKSREVALAGEAFFEVRKGELPFVVIIEGAAIRVMGTQFNVKSRNKKIEVVVSEGVVEVASTLAHKDSVIILTKGQATIFRIGESPALPQQIYSEYPAWTSGKLAFYREPLKNIIAELERRFEVTIQLMDTTLENETFTVQEDDLDTILTKLCELTDKKYRKENDGYTIY